MPPKKKPKIEVYYEDCHDRIPKLKQRFHSLVCDPDHQVASATNIHRAGPGHAKGQGWEDLTFSDTYEWVSQALEVMLPGGWLVAVLGQRYYHRIATAADQAGWEIREMAFWHHNQGQLLGTQVRQDGWSIRLKPDVLPILMARRPLEGNTLECFTQYGTGLLNIEDNRDPERGTWPSSLMYFKKTGHQEMPEVDGEARHTTPKPLPLMRHLIRLTTPVGGWLLEPFAGSGTTLEAAKLEGVNAVGIEREPAFRPLIEARLARV